MSLIVNNICWQNQTLIAPTFPFCPASETNLLKHNELFQPTLSKIPKQFTKLLEEYSACENPTNEPKTSFPTGILRSAGTQSNNGFNEKKKSDQKIMNAYFGETIKSIFPNSPFAAVNQKIKSPLNWNFKPSFWLSSKCGTLYPTSSPINYGSYLTPSSTFKDRQKLAELREGVDELKNQLQPLVFGINGREPQRGIALHQKRIEEMEKALEKVQKNLDRLDELEVIKKNLKSNEK